MPEYLNSPYKNYVNKKSILVILIALLCQIGGLSNLQAETEEQAEQQAAVELTERQQKLLENLGVEYTEGETFEEIMSRAHSAYRSQRDTRLQSGEEVVESIEEITPAMLQMQDEAAEAARKEYEARRQLAIQKGENRNESQPQQPLEPNQAEQPIDNDTEEKSSTENIETNEVDEVDETDKTDEKEEQDEPKQQTKRLPDESNKELELTITLPEKVEITSLIELVGKQLGLNYIYDPAEVKGDVMLKVHDGKIKVKDTYALLESVLRFRGFVMTRRGNLVTIVPAAKATEIDPIIIDNGQEIQPGDVIVTNIFRLTNITTDIAQNLLTSMNLSSSIISLPETRSIIVTGYAYRMARIEQMLSLIDVPGEQRTFSYRRLEYTLAASVVDKIQALAENLGTVDVTIATGATQQGGQASNQPVRRDSRGRIIPQPAQAAQQGQQQASTDVIQSQTAKYGVYLDIDDRTNRILIVGTENDILEVNKLIDTFDVPKQDLRKLIKYTIIYADAGDILTALESLNIITGGDQQNQRIAATRTPTQQGQQQQQQAATDVSGNVLLDEPQVVMIEQSNSLLVNATDEQHEKIVAIIAHIDQEPEEDLAPVKVYPLENQSVEDIQETLTSVVEKVAQEKASQEQGTTAAAASSTGKIQRTAGSTGKNMPGVVITGDAGTNSIVVFASRKDQEWIAELIKNLDKKRPQVLIDVTLVEITKKDRFEYDLEHSIAKSLETASGVAGAPMSIGSGTAPLGNNLDGSFDGSTTKGFYSDSHIQSLLTIIEEKNYGRIMAKPKLLVNDNQEGSIKTTNKTYKPTDKTDYVGNDNPTAVVTTTWESYEAGVELLITPHISEGELLRLDIMINRTDFDFTSSERDSDRPYDTVTSNVETIVTVPNKSTIILGGLITINQGKGGGKVPILGDLPLVGGIFKSIKNSDEQSKLYVFVKANILRPNESNSGLPDLEFESEIHQQSFEESEIDFQKKQDWPGFDAELMEPERVLDMK